MDCLRDFNPQYDYTPEQFGMTPEKVKATLDRGGEWRYERDYFPNGTPKQITFTWYPIVWIEGDDVGFVYDDDELEQTTTRLVDKRIKPHGSPQDAHFICDDLSINSDGYIFHDGYWVGVLSGIENVEQD